MVIVITKARRYMKLQLSPGCYFHLVLAANTEDGVHLLESHVILVGCFPISVHGGGLLTCGEEVIVW
jgi:hypothetical protein